MSAGGYSRYLLTEKFGHTLYVEILSEVEFKSNGLIGNFNTV